MSQHSLFMSPQSFGQAQRVSCCNKTFYVATECGQDQGALCSDTTFCVMTKLVKARSFYVATEFGLRQGFCVATEYFISRHSMAK